MHRSLLFLALVPTLILLAAGTAHSGILGSVSAGAYGVSNTPISQDDSDTGGLFGIRGRAGILFFDVEGSINWLGHADASDNVKAPDVVSYAFNGILRTGFIYWTAGIGATTLDSDALDETDDTYNFGLGAEIGFGRISVDVSPRLFVINNKGDGTREDLAFMVGANYKFF
jgi:hypothetical protein